MNKILFIFSMILAGMISCTGDSLTFTDTKGERMDKVIDAMVATGKVLEINHRYKIPNKAFIMKAKETGLKFTFGTNNTEGDFGKLEYCIQMKDECGITATDMYKPNIKD